MLYRRTPHQRTLDLSLAQRHAATATQKHASTPARSAGAPAAPGTAIAAGKPSVNRSSNS
jgi:hypothetical protein